MNREQVVALMEGSKSEAEWNANCDKVKEACGDYPDFWFPAILQSGLAKRVAAKWGGTDGFRVTAFGR